MEYKQKKPAVRIIVPDRPTVRQQLAYHSGAVPSGIVDWFVFWEASKTLIEVWECGMIPDQNKVDLDKETDPQIAQIIAWVGSTVRSHMLRLESLPKNS